MNNRIVTVDLAERSYDIFIGRGLLTRLTDFLPFDIKGRTIFIIGDENTQKYVDQVKATFGDAQNTHTKIIPPGEASKSFENIQRITDWMLQNGVNRNSPVFAVGGGVVGDLTGFAAAITMRGLPFVQIPTTLLSQVDSSVGGKTGINTSHGKNLIGSFYQPEAVIIDIDTLNTLPQRQVIAGYAEVAKYGLINNSGFFNWLDQNAAAIKDKDTEALAYAIEESVKSKAAIVKADEKEENDQRALLNLGHTFGHAFETAANYDGRLLHGEAISIGMVMAFELSARMNLCEREDVERVAVHLDQMGLPVSLAGIAPPLNLTADKMITLMRRDKKAVSGTMRFILANGIGEAFISNDVQQDTLRGVLNDFLSQADTKSSAQTKKDLSNKTRKEFSLKGVKGLWTSAFSSHS